MKIRWILFVVLMLMIPGYISSPVTSKELALSKLPRKVKILNSTYTIHYVKHPGRPSEKLYGVSYLLLKRIEVRTTDPIDEIESTLVHEILHCVAFESGVDLREDQVRRLEVGFHEMLKANGWNWLHSFKR